MKKIKLTSEDVAQANLDAEIAANLQALGIDARTVRPMTDTIFAALVQWCRDAKSAPTITDLSRASGYSRRQVSNALGHLADHGRVLPVGGKSGLYIPRVVKPARVP